MPRLRCLSTYVERACVIIVALTTSLVSLHIHAPVVKAQDTLTGAFEGTVTNSRTGERVSAALVEIINQASGVTMRLRTDAQGRFYRGLLPPEVYLIRVTAPGFKTAEKEQLLFTTAPNQVIPIPVSLDPENMTSAPAPSAGTSAEDRDVVAEINRTDARRSGAFTGAEVETLPLGGTTLVRTFDELALLLPGVAPAPQTFSSVAGPGIGAGVGTSGQFAVNGLRSRANNFTVDGSDNNDEDIGVRRQGFLALVPQPVESIKEYQVTTLLAPAQFGRNIGAQVNAVSKSGGNETHGTLYGFFNSSQLNARNYFDTANGNAIFPLRAGNLQVLRRTDPVNQPLTVRNQSGGEDSLTFGQGGLAFGGPLAPDRMFYFISAEGQLSNATREESFAVPTIEQRGIFGSGATGLFRNPFTGAPGRTLPFSTTTSGTAIFSLFPFPNNPRGIYGANTFTQRLPASGQGKILSGKFDGNFKVRQRQQQLTARYNFTDDFRDIPATGRAIFSTLRPRVGTQNFSTFLNSELSGPDATRPIFNQVRASYGRTRLRFDERRDEEFLLRSELLPDEPFILNAQVLNNTVRPPSQGCRTQIHCFFSRI